MDIGFYWNFWRYFGTPMMLSKAWERFVIDRHRFRSGIDRVLPEFKTAEDVSDGAPFPLTAGKPLTICYLIHCFYPDNRGGTERFILNLAKAQQAMGNRVQVITLGKRRADEYSRRTANILWEEFDYEGVPVAQLRYVRAPRGLYYDAILPEDADMAAYAAMALERYKPDLVHIAYPQPFAAFAAQCRRAGVPYCVTLTDFNMLCHYATMVCKSGQFCAGSEQGALCRQRCKTYGVTDTEQRFKDAREMLLGAAEITVPSHFVANVFKQELPELTIRVVPHGISGDFTVKRRRSETRQFLYAGSLSELKGIPLLIEAFKKLPGDVRLKICGGGAPPYEKLLKSLAAGDPRISFAGAIGPQDMPQVYREADCVIVPSVWYETYNFVLREALACGCIGIASNTGAMPEVIRHGENGFVFQAGSVDALLDAMEKALTFDWAAYTESSFPAIGDEAAEYQKIYRHMSESYE